MSASKPQAQLSFRPCLMHVSSLSHPLPFSSFTRLSLSLAFPISCFSLSVLALPSFLTSSLCLSSIPCPSPLVCSLQILHPLKLSPTGDVQVDARGMTSVSGVFAGGDLIGGNLTAVSVGDGKLAARGMHMYLAQKAKVPILPALASLPGFHSAIDDVDIR